MTGTYQEMQDDIENDLGDSGVNTSALRQSKILAAIRMYQKERFWFLETTDTFATVDGTATYDLPTDIRTQDHRLRMTVDTEKVPLVYRPVEWMNNNFSSTTTGQPQAFTIEAGLIRLGPIPDDAYTITRTYFAELTVLSGGSDTNAWLTHGEELIRQCALRQLHEIDRNFEMAALHGANEQAALARLRRQSAEIMSPGRMNTSHVADMVNPSVFNINVG